MRVVEHPLAHKKMTLVHACNGHGALPLALQSFQRLIAVKIAKKRQISADQHAKTKIHAQRYSLPSIQHDMSIYPQGRIPSIHVFRSRKQLKQSQCIEACELELQTAVHHLAEVVCTCIVLESRSLAGHPKRMVIMWGTLYPRAATFHCVSYTAEACCTL